MEEGVRKPEDLKGAPAKLGPLVKTPGTVCLDSGWAAAGSVGVVGLVARTMRYLYCVLFCSLLLGGLRCFGLCFTYVRKPETNCYR
ncbi:hypothetical protein M0802_007597 [Mischocyttarus mexicanus]|nr:hypothetical protein M0802_007597 [Mischocyttarus mexicanus]